MILKVMTYNILDGGIGRKQAILEVLQTIAPDIVILQEVTDSTTLQEFAETLDMNFFFAQSNSKRHPALLSKLPIIYQYSHHPFPPIRTAILEATVEYQSGQHLHLFGLHLTAFPLIILEWWRTWEIKITLEEIIKYQTVPCLVAGDFNTISPEDRVERKTLPLLLKILFALQSEKSFHSAIKKILSAGLTDCYRLLHTEDGFTLPPPNPNSRLDYIFVNERLKSQLKRCYVVSEPAAVHKASDHYPVLAEFEL